MSWISENHEKAALGAAAVIALALVSVGWKKSSSVEDDFSATPSGGGSNVTDVKEGDLVQTANASFQIKRQWTKGADKDRPVDLFTGIPLFVNKNNPNTPVDLISGEPVHPPIPNQWWIDNRIDPGYGDSPLRDEDGDGFSNLEEYLAKTDPNDNRDYPGLISKLSYAGDEFVRWVLRPGFLSAEGSLTFEYVDTSGVNQKTSATNAVAQGELFFSDGEVQERFKFVGTEDRMVKNRMDNEEKVTFAIIEDQKANKKGMTYEIPSRFRKNEEEYAKQSHFDRTAVLTLDALDLTGQEFKVEEFTEFALPPSAKNKEYKLTEVTPESITIEHTPKDGETKTYVIQKGATGPSGN